MTECNIIFLDINNNLKYDSIFKMCTDIITPSSLNKKVNIKIIINDNYKPKLEKIISFTIKSTHLQWKTRLIYGQMNIPSDIWSLIYNSAKEYTCIKKIHVEQITYNSINFILKNVYEYSNSINKLLYDIDVLNNTYNIKDIIEFVKYNNTLDYKEKFNNFSVFITKYSLYTTERINIFQKIKRKSMMNLDEIEKIKKIDYFGSLVKAKYISSSICNNITKKYNESEKISNLIHFLKKIYSLYTTLNIFNGNLYELSTMIEYSSWNNLDTYIIRKCGRELYNKTCKLNSNISINTSIINDNLPIEFRENNHLLKMIEQLLKVYKYFYKIFCERKKTWNKIIDNIDNTLNNFEISDDIISLIGTHINDNASVQTIDDE